MNLHIIGICGTFMGGIARLARELGMHVTGSDANTYPPMSTQLENLGIELSEGYRAENIPHDADLVIVGNTISRGNPELEHVLERDLTYTSGAQWLSQHVLQGRWVLAVAGTHGKTTTSSLLAWILNQNGMSPGFLIGGVPENFGESARLGETPFFVIEADEYDTAFSDKRSKFVHYRPRTLILNNLEFDHADIFDDLGAIQSQFHHLLKIVPRNGQVICNNESDALHNVIKQGIWSELQTFGNQGNWQVKPLEPSCRRFEVSFNSASHVVEWDIIGKHNMYNALAAIAAAHHAGITLEHACQAVTGFQSVKRRLQTIYDDDRVRVLDDFAHHPTAIKETLNALRAEVGESHIIAVLEPRSNTMKRGVHKDLLPSALQSANKALVYADDEVLWDIDEISSERIITFSSISSLEDAIIGETVGQSNTGRSAEEKTHILIMSNGGFSGLHQKVVSALENSAIKDK